MKYLIIAVLSLLSVTGCKKKEDNPPPPPPTPPVVNTPPDSVWLIRNVTAAANGIGESYFFEYDSTNKLVKFYMPYSWAVNSPCYVFYKNDKVDYVVSDYKDPNYGVQKASLILTYGSNNKCSKVFYKPPVKGYINSATYFSDTNDGRLYPQYDSLTYTASGQLENIYYLDKQNSPLIPVKRIKFYYPTAGDSVCNKIESYTFDVAGNSVLYDQILLTTTAVPNLFYKQLPYFCFVKDLTILSGIGTMTLPILLDAPSTNLAPYLSFLPKALTGYKVVNN